MSIKTDIPQVRTPQDLERKYDLSSIKNIKETTKNTSNELKNTQKELLNFTKKVIGDLNGFQNQLDGKIETYYGYEEPSLNNEPANAWNESIYADHVNDLYYDKETGYAYRFNMKDGIYYWEKLSDESLAQALAIANAAKDTADGKKRVFTSKPTPPYDNGDLWLNAGEIFVCQISKSSEGTFEESDFIIATDYETNTNATATKKELTSKLEVVSGRVTTVETNTYKKTEINQILEGNYTDANGNEIVTKVVKTVSGTFDENGMHYEKTGAKTNSTINEKGVSVETTQNNDELLFAGYDEELKESIVRTENLTVRKYFICGSNSRFEDYTDEEGNVGTGVFDI